MKTVSEYRIISAFYSEGDASGDRDKLSKQVNEYIGSGWQPFGQVGVSTLNGTLILTQPMVRYREHA